MSDINSGIPGAAPAASVPPAAAKGAAITALVTGLVGLLLIVAYMTTDVGTFALWVGPILGLLGLILGIIALRRRQSKAMAVIGLIAGVLAMLVAFAVTAFALIFVGAFLPLLP